MLRLATLGILAATNFGYECMVDNCRVVGVICQRPNGEDGGPWNPGCATHTLHIDECESIPILNIYRAAISRSGTTLQLSGTDGVRNASMTFEGFDDQVAIVSGTLRVEQDSGSSSMSGQCQLEELSE